MKIRTEHGTAKLTWKQVEAARALVKKNPNVNRADIARQLGVQPRALYDILSGKSWRRK